MFKKKTNSNTKKVLQYLKTHKRGITSMIAFDKLKITRLSAVIFELKKAGYNIVTEMETTTNQNGNTCRYARYFLVEED